MPCHGLLLNKLTRFLCASGDSCQRLIFINVLSNYHYAISIKRESLHWRNYLASRQLRTNGMDKVCNNRAIDFEFCYVNINTEVVGNWLREKRSGARNRETIFITALWIFGTKHEAAENQALNRISSLYSKCLISPDGWRLFCSRIVREIVDTSVFTHRAKCHKNWLYILCVTSKDVCSRSMIH